VAARQCDRAFGHYGIDRKAYRRKVTKLDGEDTATRLELTDLEAQEIDVETALRFASRLFADVAGAWRGLPDVQKRIKLQQALFPERLAYDSATAVAYSS